VYRSFYHLLPSYYVETFRQPSKRRSDEKILPLNDLKLIETPTEKYLVQLYEDYRKRRERWVGKKLPFCEQRPKTISYGEGLEIRLERDATHPTLTHFDRVAIQTPKGVFILNEMTDKPVLFFDSGEDFELHSEYKGPRQGGYYVVYGSERLQKSKRNLYVLLHEFCHLDLNTDRRYGSKVELEPAVWKATDKLVQRIGLQLFDNETERMLYRDVNLRTYDPFGEAGLIKEGLMAGIDRNKFQYEVIKGLIEASFLGLPLEPLCKKLIEEKKANSGQAMRKNVKIC
jgi:hypothetical protein